jgi:hypothetical protein
MIGGEWLLMAGTHGIRVKRVKKGKKRVLQLMGAEKTAPTGSRDEMGKIGGNGFRWQ